MFTICLVYLISPTVGFPLICVMPANRMNDYHLSSIFPFKWQLWGYHPNHMTRVMNIHYCDVNARVWLEFWSIIVLGTLVLELHYMYT